MCIRYAGTVLKIENKKLIRGWDHTENLLGCGKDPVKRFFQYIVKLTLTINLFINSSNFLDLYQIVRNIFKPGNVVSLLYFIMAFEDCILKIYVLSINLS